MEHSDYFEQLRTHLRRFKLVEQGTEDPHLIKIIRNFFANHENMTNSMVHAFAEKIGLPPDRVESIAFSMLRDLLRLGRHRDIDDEQFSAKELNDGIEVEKEHTDDLSIAKEIAKDHLAECSKYYTFLSKMEKECKGK